MQMLSRTIPINSKTWKGFKRDVQKDGIVFCNIYCNIFAAITKGGAADLWSDSNHVTTGTGQ